MGKYLGVERVAFNIAGYDVYWYGVVISLSIIIAIAVAMLLCKFKKYPIDMPVNIAIVILPTGIFGARLFAVLFDSSLKLNEFLNFRTGGMSILGAVIFGGLGLLVYCLIKKEKNLYRYFDVLAVVLLLAQAIGRWGNYFNSEVYGQIVAPDSQLAFFPFVVNIDGVLYQALFFYEFVLNLIGFAVLVAIFMKTKRNGFVTIFYLIFYGMIRIVLESFRQPQYVLKMFGLPVSQIVSGLMIAFGVIFG